MRTLHSAKNLFFSILATILSILLGFITRKIFIDNIGIEYLGLNGLLYNILGAVALLESGFGISITYNLYKPLAENNEEEVTALTQLYHRIYKWIAFAILCISLLLVPFLDIFIHDAEKPDFLIPIFLIFVINTLIPYFTAHKRALIGADQKGYKLARIDISYQIASSIAKILILYYTQNYILFLLIETILLLTTNTIISYRVNTLYPYINTKEKYSVDENTKRSIKTIVKASFISGIGGYFMYSSSNILMSTYISLAVVGLYSNYKLIIDSVSGIVSQFINCSGASIGNLIASQDREYVYKVFRSVMLLNFIVAMTAGSSLMHLLNPFIEWWIGAEYCFSTLTVFLLISFFLLNALRMSIFTFKTKSGIYHPDRYTALLQGIINVVAALVLVHFYDLNGILLALNISVLAIGFWQTPRLVYKLTFQKPLYLYFIDYAAFLGIGILAHLLSTYIFSFSETELTLGYMMYMGIISVIIVLITYVLVLYKSESLRFLLSHINILKPNRTN